MPGLTSKSKGNVIEAFSLGHQDEHPGDESDQSNESDESDLRFPLSLEIAGNQPISFNPRYDVVDQGFPARVRSTAALASLFPVNTEEDAIVVCDMWSTINGAQFAASMDAADTDLSTVLDTFTRLAEREQRVHDKLEAWFKDHKDSADYLYEIVEAHKFVPETE